MLHHLSGIKIFQCILLRCTLRDRLIVITLLRHMPIFVPFFVVLHILYYTTGPLSYIKLQFSYQKNKEDYSHH